MLIGYARVSTEDQNLDRQIDQLKAVGVKKIYCDKLTGTNTNRPKLKDMLDNVREGDTIIITDLTRISRSLKDLLALTEEISSKGVHIKSLKETIDTTSAQGKFFFHITAAFSQFERDLISERTKEGLASARARGKLGGRRSKLTDKDKATVKKLYDAKELTVAEICRTYGISRPTLYKATNENKQ
jgi:DNA invertase Pin-like site-specific DNA recombinase